uniref:Uncharacterized protein n=1 Tax=Trypanosoma vivax (strain Y486) TaxID=1055687 RepID=G0UCX9_TRYVY|nr:hypothetical protein, unlikely [Trypanosoma vivax Y486]
MEPFGFAVETLICNEREEAQKFFFLKKKERKEKTQEKKRLVLVISAGGRYFSFFLFFSSPPPPTATTTPEKKKRKEKKRVCLSWKRLCAGTKLEGLQRRKTLRQMGTQRRLSANYATMRHTEHVCF